ncbi:MAG: hypothetical protein ACUVSX_00445 [Aggregatilineales bacterium]
MTDNKKRALRQQVKRVISDPVMPLEHKVARALIDTGEYLGTLTADELAVIMRKVLYTLVDEQKVAGLDVPLVHNVSRMDVSIAAGEAAVSCEVHIHAPIKAFITFNYVLENDHQSNNGRLRLKNNWLDVHEVTRPFDIGAKAALKVMGVRHIALQELNDLNGVIRRTLPPRLHQLGFKGELKDVALELQDNGTMVVYLTGRQP